MKDWEKKKVRQKDGKRRDLRGTGIANRVFLKYRNGEL